MSGVLERLQALVATGISQADATAAVAQDAGNLTTTRTQLLSGDTLRPPPVHRKQRPRRQTDATVSSVSTAASTDSGSSATASPSLSPLATAPASSKQEMEKLLSYRMKDLERVSRLHPVSKVLQQEGWDCGLACVCMLLRAFGQPTCTVAQLARQAQTASVWTVDLAFLIRRNLPHADFTYYTTCAGINPDHTQNRFYDDMLDDEERRVMRLFASARTEPSIRIVEIAIPLLDLKRFLFHRHYVAVLLVDGAALTCTACERARSSATGPTVPLHLRPGSHSRSRSINIFRSPKPADGAAPTEAPSRTGLFSWFSRRRHARDGYLGHYILLFAYIPSLDVFLYRDPAIPEEFCLASAATVNAARTRSGTDADCIIVKL
ncbi:hypothetical protein IW140_003766 [Coemansia sp. RSA 1813]|nr:hypothetical protein EV178_003518 [Coemansia sp. RSA 1646]KAJ1772796.1 hypothetical protein LPJ74_001135 [Coemansia sp. RSA 1843]KAJ2088662.1 hypothetical protein IW138_004044 [Coemansia sp. RSA 986]KAJ2213133.1 hypothetical protein EV179_004103 [Coemansia sp. RSA 487]KAJ2568560.1 hypothetical protein IW140_003766 [Coemansia sp. RSA 1813]